MARKEAGKTTVRFTLTSATSTGMNGMIQTEDRNGKEKRVLFGDSGLVEASLSPGKYVFVWAVKMVPVRRHKYGLKVQRIPETGEPVELRKRPDEHTTTEGEDVGWDDFEL
jgi:hypothetical protein